MRERMERFVVLPFSVGCISNSSVAVLGSPLTLHNHKRSKSRDSITIAPELHEEDDEESMKNMFNFLALSKPEISTGFNRLFKSFKTFSQLFGEKEEMEEFETDMEIGLPTEVKHVSHIGWEGPITSDPRKGYQDLMPPELVSQQPRVSISTDNSHLVND